MINLGARSKLDPVAVIREAVAYFGEGGYGLTVHERTESSVHFDGGGGFVAVSAAAKDDGSEVMVVSQEWEHQAEQFLDRL